MILTSGQTGFGEEIGNLESKTLSLSGALLNASHNLMVLPSIRVTSYAVLMNGHNIGFRGAVMEKVSDE